MTDAGTALRRLASQGIAVGGDDPAEVVRRLVAVQSQDYGQSLWAVGSRLRRGTVARVEEAVAGRQIVRTWLMRGTIHLVAAEDVRWLLALCAPRLAVAEERRREQLGITAAEIERCAALLRGELAGDRRLSRPDAFALFESEGVETTGQRGYHILVRLARDALICVGPLQGKQPTLVLLDDWAPLAGSRVLAGVDALADLAARFVSSRGPATDHDLALMRASTSKKVQVKAAGGVRDLDALMHVRDLGTTRCGATATATMLDEYRRRAAADRAARGSRRT